MRFTYVRYADDWVILINGKMALAKLIKNKAKAFLNDYLGLELALDKTFITSLTKGFDFLGFTLSIPTTKNKKVEKGSVFYDAKRTTSGIQVGPCKSRLLFKMTWKGFCDKTGFPREQPAYSTKNMFEIIAYYNSCMRGLA